MHVHLPRAIDSAMGNPHSHAGIPFLNQYLQMLDQSVPFGVLTIAILVFWLQLCMVKGVFVLGLRIFVIGIHPMKYGKTLANSFLVNVSIVLCLALINCVLLRGIRVLHCQRMHQ